MSWCDRRALVSMLLAAALGGCTVAPLYAPDASGRSVSAALDTVAVDPVDSRVGQEVRNRLLFKLTGGTAASAPLYRLHLNVASSEIALGVTPVQSSPAYSVTVTTTYELTSVATGVIVLRATTRQSASYDRVNQVFANTRARLDAEDRAAVLAADDIHIALASAAATGRI
jgi:LPS-assembly lipoprotein